MFILGTIDVHQAAPSSMALFDRVWVPVEKETKKNPWKECGRKGKFKAPLSFRSQLKVGYGE